MYLPKSKYKVSTAKPGEFVDSSGQEYVGPVVETFTGAVYPGTDPMTMGQRLTPAGDKDSGQALGFYNIKRIPTEQEYSAGQMTRYFVQEKRTQKIIEIAPDVYENADKTDITRIFRAVTWLLTGNRAVVQKANDTVVEELEKVMPGIVSSMVLYNPLQFYRP